MRSEGYSSCFVISVCLFVCLLPRFQPLRATRRPISDTNGFSATLALFLKKHFLLKQSYGVKQSEEANMQISTGLPVLSAVSVCTLEAPEVATQGER